MNPSAVEKITPHPNEPLQTAWRILPPAIAFLLRWGIFALIAIVIVLSTDSRPGTKVALDAATRLRGHILDPSVGQVGNLWRSFIRFNSLPMDQSPLRGEEHRLVGGKQLLQQGDRHPADASRTINIDVSPKLLVLAIDAGIVILSLLFALSVSGQWDTYLRFRYGGSFGVADPLFGVDLGFYVFRLPFYELLQGSITVLTVLALAILTFCALFGMRQSKSTGKITLRDGIAQHFIVLLFILVANFGWGFILDHYELVYSTLGVVHGAGYAAAHVTRVALWVMTGASALACVLLAFGFFRPRSEAGGRRHCDLRSAVCGCSVGAAFPLSDIRGETQ